MADTTENAKVAKARFQVTMSRDLYDALNRQCAQMGVTRSEYVDFVVGANIAQIENAQRAIAENLTKAIGGLHAGAEK